MATTEPEETALWARGLCEGPGEGRTPPAALVPGTQLGEAYSAVSTQQAGSPHDAGAGVSHLLQIIAACVCGWLICFPSILEVEMYPSILITLVLAFCYNLLRKRMGVDT